MSTETVDAFVSEVCERVRGGTLLRPRGAGTKQPLLGSAEDVQFLDMSALTGITEYDPNEFTFTAFAGTKLADLQQVLAERGQGLPFDPPLVAAGATLGGTVAAGLSGPCRLTHGGLRDFILGVQFIDGMGNLIRGGGKVVKNAAGFDLPKFFVGSAGRFGVLVEMTFKVFPMPKEHLTVCYEFDEMASALRSMTQISLAPLQIEALDLLPAGSGSSLAAESRRVALTIRLGGDLTAVDKHASRIDRLVGQAGDRIGGEEDGRVWCDAREFRWRESGQTLVKVPITPQRIVDLESRFVEVGLRRRYSVAGNVVWLAVANEQFDACDRILQQCSLAGMAILGEGFSRCRQGAEAPTAFFGRIKRALDPLNKFGDLL